MSASATGETGATIYAVHVSERLGEVRQRIRAAGRDESEVTVVAVTKGFGAEAVRAALAAGLRDIGENYAPELLAKAGLLAASETHGTAVLRGGAGLHGASETHGAAETHGGAETHGAAGLHDAAGLHGGAGLHGAPRWHYLGAVQRNKVARLAPVVACWQSVDRLEEGEAIARRAPGARVFVEVDLSGLTGRGGVPAAEVGGLVEGLAAYDLVVAGLMTVAPPGGGGRARDVFERVARLVADLGLEEASMGMSGDLDEALAAGSTMLRIGSGLFGPRPAPAQVRE